MGIQPHSNVDAFVHPRRWKERKLIATCFVEFNGKPVASVKKGFNSAVEFARLSGKVTLHTLRHTAATWLMQRGGSHMEAAGFLGMSTEVLQETCTTTRTTCEPEP